jgi:hypothetical protein
MAFIFQAKPSIYPLEEKLKVDREVGWLASRLRDEMKLGDIVYYWRAGEEEHRGIYGWGNITSDGPFVDSRGTYRVAVTCRKIFESHINVTELRTHPILRGLQILHNAMGTNFLITQEENDALFSLIIDKFDPSWVPNRER